MPSNLASEADLTATERLGRRMRAHLPPSRPKPLADRVCIWGVRVLAMIGMMAVIAVLIAGMVR